MRRPALAAALALSACLPLTACGDDQAGSDVVPKTVPALTAPEQSGIPAQTTTTTGTTTTGTTTATTDTTAGSGGADASTPTEPSSGGASPSTGTGGTSGAGYLEGALRQHYIFKELTEVSTFLIERSKLPELPKAVREKMSFNS